MRSKILTSVVAVYFVIGVAQPLRAQGVKKISSTAARSGTASGLAPTDAERQPSGQYPPQALEELRTQLLDLADTVLQFGALAPPSVELDDLKAAKTQIQQMSYPQLNVLRQGISPSKMGSRLKGARQAIAGYTRMNRLQPRYVDTNAFPTVSGFCDPIGNAVAGAIGGSNPGGSTAGPARIPVGVILAADIVFFVADSVRELAQDACKQDVLGENTSTVCIIVDIVWIVAKAVDEGLHFCDDDLTGNVIDTNYARLDDVHTDVNNVGSTLDTHLTTANTDIDNRIASLDTHLTNVDTHITSEFATLSALVTTLIANLSAQLTAAENKLVDGDIQIMKLDMTPDGLRQLVGTILTCDGTTSNPCPNVLSQCPLGKCSWNNVGPLP